MDYDNIGLILENTSGIEKWIASDSKKGEIVKQPVAEGMVDAESKIKQALISFRKATEKSESIDVENTTKVSASISELPEVKTVLSEKTEILQDDKNVKLFEKILSEKFPKGYRLGSVLDMKKFRRYYKEIYGTELELSDPGVKSVLLASGICHERKLFAPSGMCSPELRAKIFSHIREEFAQGKKALYYEAIFHTFAEEFLDYSIYDAGMLKEYLAFYNKDGFFMGGQYISREAGWQANPVEEIKDYLVSEGVPVDVDEICRALSHIPQKKIMQLLAAQRQFIRNSKGFYFHVDIVHISEKELDGIARLMMEGIEERSFLSGNELTEMIRARYPLVIENNPAISDMGMRDTLKYYLNERFSFHGNVISDIHHKISMNDVFGRYAGSREEFTLSELESLASEVNSTIIFDAVYDHSLRISKTQFVSRDRAAFHIEETDRAIARFFSKSYVSIGEIRNFGLLPDAGFAWNSYLLEYYAYAYSRKYRLLHARFNGYCCVGGIVSRDSGIETFEDLLAIVLAESEAVLEKNSALSYFVEKGYLANRRYAGIEKVLIRANTYT